MLVGKQSTMQLGLIVVPADGQGAYESYDPLALAQHAGGHVQAFDTFDAAVDEFYSKAGPCLLSC